MIRKWVAIRSASSGVFGIGCLALDMWCLVPFLSYFNFLFLLSVFICVNPWFHSYGRAGIAAAGLYGHVTAAAKRTFGGVIVLDLEFHQGFGAEGQLHFGP